MPFADSSKRGFSSKWGAPSSSVSDPLDKVDTQIGNAKLRIQSAGGDVNPDKRNWFEKATNLPEGQNFLFDTLDLLGRPQQALYGAVDAAADGKSIGGGAMLGFKGRQKITGSDFMGDLGVENKYAKAALGFGMDVIADPVNLIPGAIIAKGVKGIGQGAKAAYNVAEKAVPVLEPIKDGLGNVFKHQYKWDQTLDGGKSDLLKNKFNQTENDIRYMGENSLKTITQAAKQAGGVDTGETVGRLMEKDLVMNGPRPARELSNDPKITEATGKLMESNKMLRDWSVENDIPVGEIESYMKHIWSAEESALRKKAKGKPVDRPMSGLNNPDKKILNARKLSGSVEDINEQLGRKFFEPNAYFSAAVGQKKLIEYGNAVKFRREVLSNSDFARPYTKGDEIPTGAEVINTNNYKFLRKEDDTLPDEIGGEYVVTKGAKQALERYNKLTTDEGINALLKTYDKGLSLWKRATLLSVPYHIRNDIGAKFNAFVSGMGVHHIAKYSTIAEREVRAALTGGVETKMYDEFRREGLSSTSQAAVEFAKRGDEPEEALRKIVGDQSKVGLSKAKSLANPKNIFDTSQKLANYIDQTNRYALYKWAREVQKMSPGEAAAKVRETLFDYSRVTPTEREVFARLAPFYRWSRFNIPFQIRQFAEHPRRYMAVNKLRTNLQDSMGIDDENTSDYLKESMAFPITGDGKGKGHMLGVNLPVSDLTKLSSPLKLGIDSLSPLGKVPIELNANKSFFFNNQIEKFDGQEKKYRIPEKIYGARVPGGGKELGGIPIKAAYAIEQFGGQPVKGLTNTFAEPTIQDKENQSLKPTLGISTLFKKYDINDTNLRQKQKELRELLDMIDYLEQEQGVRPKTLAELKKEGR